MKRRGMKSHHLLLALSAAILAHPCSAANMAGVHGGGGQGAGGRDAAAAAAAAATMSLRMRGGGVHGVASRSFGAAPHAPSGRQYQHNMAGTAGGHGSGYAHHQQQGQQRHDHHHHHHHHRQQQQQQQQPSFDRYPRSYPEQESNRAAHHQQRQATPWKVSHTPNYIHAKPKPAATAADIGVQRFGEVVTVQATEEQTATVIWLHGLGDTGHTWSAVASWLRMGYCKFIFPTAPSQPVTVSQGYSMPSWFDFNSLEAFEIDEDIDSLQRSVTYLLSLVESEIASGVPPERIILAGFAQGGVVALNAALQSKKNLGGVMALSTWLPKRLPEPLSEGAPKVPIWFCHGTDDRVVKYSLGLDGYHKCLSMKLDAHFKAYDGLGHEYGSQEMVDVQTFLENRIPSNPKQANAATNGLEGLLEPSIMHRSLKAMGGGSCAQQMPRRKVTVGGVPVLFNAPWQYGIGMGIFEEAGLDVEWKDCHGGTASMTNSLNRGVLDVAVLSTDGAVADIAHGGTYRILSSFVTSPLRYGVYVSAEASDVTDACQLEGCAFAISRRASLSHVMTYLHATQSGWNPREWDATKSSLVEVGNLAGAREALASGRAHGLLWEMGTAKPLVDSGEFRLVGECSPPWPSFVIAVREGMLTGKNAETTRRLAAALQTCCAQFSRWGGRVGMVCERYGMKAEDARARLQGLEWRRGDEQLAEDVLDEVGFTLVAVGLLATFPNTDNMMCSLEEEATPRGGAEVRRMNDGGVGHKTVAWGGGGGGGRRVEWATGSQLHDEISIKDDGSMREDTASAREDLSEYGDSRERLRAGRGIDDRRESPSGGRIEEEVKRRDGVGTKVDRKREDEVDGQMRDSSYSSDEESYEPVFRKLDEGTMDLTARGTEAMEGAIKEMGDRSGAEPWRPPHNRHEQDDERSVGGDDEERNQAVSAILERSTLSTAPSSRGRVGASVGVGAGGSGSDLTGNEPQGRSVRFKEGTGGDGVGSGKTRGRSTPHPTAGVLERSQSEGCVDDDGDDQQEGGEGLKSGASGFKVRFASVGHDQLPGEGGKVVPKMRPKSTPHPSAGVLQPQSAGLFASGGAEEGGEEGGGGQVRPKLRPKSTPHPSAGVLEPSNMGCEDDEIEDDAGKVARAAGQGREAVEEFVTSTTGEESPADSEARKQRTKALSLRKMRDSCASVRREAARREALASRGQGEWNNSPSSPLGKIEPSNLFSQPPTPPYPSNAAVASKDIDQQRHSAVTTSDDSPSGGDRSKEDHTAEFRHTLRKVMPPSKEAGSHTVFPSALFRASGAADDAVGGWETPTAKAAAGADILPSPGGLSHLLVPTPYPAPERPVYPSSRATGLAEPNPVLRYDHVSPTPRAGRGSSVYRSSTFTPWERMDGLAASLPEAHHHVVDAGIAQNQRRRLAVSLPGEAQMDAAARPLGSAASHFGGKQQHAMISPPVMARGGMHGSEGALFRSIPEAHGHITGGGGGHHGGNNVRGSVGLRAGEYGAGMARHAGPAVSHDPLFKSLGAGGMSDWRHNAAGGGDEMAEGALVPGRGGGRGMRECVEEANSRGGGTIEIPEGSEVTWGGDAVVRANGVNITCMAPGASLVGPWLLTPTSGGVFAGGDLSWGGGIAGTSCMAISGGPWLLDTCGVTCQGGAAVHCEGEARVLAQRCSLGGAGAGSKRALAGLVLVDKARCLVEESTVSDAGTGRCSGAGVRATGDARGTLERCVVERCDVCLAIGGDARLSIRASTLRDGLLAAVKSEGEGHGGKLFSMQSTRVGCQRLWFADRRPQQVKITE